MPKKYSYLTPKGEFVSLAQAAEAMGCDRGTIFNRCITDPENYSRREIQPPPPRPKVKTWTATARATWPLTWYQYKYLSFEVKDEIWLKWCTDNQKNPDLEDSVDEFFHIMDTTQETENAKDQVI